MPSLFRDRMRAAEEKILREALICYGTITAAAKELGMHRNRLSRRLINLGITSDELREYRKHHAPMPSWRDLKHEDIRPEVF